ncbi:MAG: ROK family protein [Candidatus Zipacnadales bacterium]
MTDISHILSVETAEHLLPLIEPIEAEGPLAAAIDHGGTHPRFGVFNRLGQQLLQLKGMTPLPTGLQLELPTHERMPNDPSVKSTADLPHYMADRLEEWLGPILQKVDCLGYAIAGPVTEDGVVLNTPNIWGPQVKDVPWRDMLRQRSAMPERIVVGNDMWAAANDIIARGEKQHPPYDVDNFIVITVSSGIGSKVVRNRKVDLGVDGLAGEIGHLPILWPEEIIPGRRCGCANRLYCLEAGSSGNSNAYRAKQMAERLSHLVTTSPSGKLIETLNHINLMPGKDLDKRVEAINRAVITAAEQGDPLANEILHATLRPLARAVACLETQLNVKNFYFVGGFALEMKQRFLEILREELLALGGISGRSDEQILSLGRLYDVDVHDWGLRGAALGAFLHFGLM